ncbi:ABC transporter permease [Paraburkholderia silvatlantica]|uniref:Sulfonate transport system permease protein n=1 Tax=Paraburkholderia silvatlantica TaxID=321895 RepID=A0ABR6FGS3_9BURK|nr:ABC transporter permease [Paraburkholderia silvatlantica]MBB2926630.1 sulfonate transport system permease protein [Paraburkholderia silvatlantica]PVY37736.1 sulfonate transport system permease protein [Paraburkholderia silvatlantica]PXW42699.1 sulfonate transport system permease protein [Paraburkholderia silvatlantica]
MSTRESTLAVGPVPVAGTASSRLATLREPLLRALVPVLLIALWQLASSLGVASEFVLPSPASVLAAYRELWQSGDLQDALKVSLARAAVGLLIGGGAGLLLGVAAGLSKSAERGFDSVLQMLRTIPFIALVPIFVVWFGIGEVSKVALIVGAAISPMYLSTYHAIRGIDPKLLELGRTFRLSRAHQIRLIILPMSLPGILVGVRYAAAISLLALVAAEQINASAGIGYILNNANQFQRTDIIIAGILVYAVLGISVDALLRFVERKALAWRGAHV